MRSLVSLMDSRSFAVPWIRLSATWKDSGEKVERLLIKCMFEKDGYLLLLSDGSSFMQRESVNASRLNSKITENLPGWEMEPSDVLSALGEILTFKQPAATRITLDRDVDETVYVNLQTLGH